MRRLQPGKYLKLMLLCSLFVLGGAGTVVATSQSDNFEVTEAEFGAGAALETCSGQYCAKASIGNMSAGADGVTSGESTASFGSIAEDGEPTIEVIVEDGQSNLGTLDTDSTASKTAIVKVRTYLSDGYTLQFIGDPPVYAGHSLSTPQTPSPSTPGQEQFAINVVANTTPEIGADPKQVPSEEFSFGEVEPDYATADRFKYQSGEVIARSLTESGQTEYTVSMIVNVSPRTPAGHYTADFQAFVIPAF